MRGERYALTPTLSLSLALSLTLALAWCVVNWTPEAEVGASGESPTDHSQLCTLRRSAGWYSRCAGCSPPRSCAAAARVARSGARRFHRRGRPLHLGRVLGGRG